MTRLFTFFSLISCLFAKQLSATDVSDNKLPRDVLQVLSNPGNGIFTIVYKSDTKGAVNLAVTDGTGKYVYLKTVRDFNGELKEILDLSGLPKGIYIVEAERENSRETK